MENKTPESLIAEMLIKMARFYGYDLGEEQLDLYVEVMSTFPIDKVLEAGGRYVRDTKHTKFPIPPHTILNTLQNPEPTAGILAQQVAGRIEAAISKFGYNNGPDAKDWIGEVGWQVVSLNGGWQNVCQQYGKTINDISLVKKAESIIITQDTEYHDQPINFLSDTSKSNQGLISGSDSITKLLRLEREDPK